MVTCKKCGGTNIEYKTWYNPNTKDIGDDCIFGKEDTWCEDCEEHTELNF